MNTLENFRAALAEFGLDCDDEIIVDGEIHRFCAGDDREKNSWYVLHAGPPAAGAFGCWKRDIKENWCERGEHLSHADWDQVHLQWRDAKIAREQAEAERQTEAAKTAAGILDRSRPAQASHSYLTRKGVQVLGELRESGGELVLPLRDASGALYSLQFIYADGSKKFLQGGKVTGCFFLLADKPDAPLVISEGYATGASIHEATGFAVVCAMNCGNLLTVANALRGRFPSREIILAADNDQFTYKNPGLTNATVAANSIRARLVVPRFKDITTKPKDFNDLHKLDGLAEVKKQIGNAAASADTTRIFILPNDHSAISESARHIFSNVAGTHTLFVRAGSIVELVRKSNGSSLELLNPESFRSRLERYEHKLVAWKIEDGGGKVLKPKNCSEDNAKALLATVEARELLPAIRTVAAAPVIVPDGEGVKILGPGYHPDNGGTLVAGGELPLEIPADEAAALLLATLDEFVFQSPGDKARAFAALITPALKMGGFIRGFIPVDVREADQPQTGKGFSLNLVRAIYRESAYPIALKSGGVGSLDESICAALISGKPFIAIDNVRGKLDSQFLEMILTWGDAVAARIPHRGEVLVDPGAASFQLTSNGIEATPDFAKRASITRMLKQRPGFAFKRYPEGNLRDHIAANQPRYLGAVFALIRDWCRRGRPTTNATGHDFREWAGILDAFTVYYMGENLLTGHEQAQERTANPALSWLRAVGLLVLKSGKSGNDLPAAELYELSADDQLAVPGMRQPDDHQGPQIVGRVLAKCFRDGDSLQVDHLVVERIKHSEYDSNSRKVVERKTYRFTDANSSACGPCGLNTGDSGKHPPFPESYGLDPHTPQRDLLVPQPETEALLL